MPGVCWTTSSTDNVAQEKVRHHISRASFFSRAVISGMVSEMRYITLLLAVTVLLGLTTLNALAATSTVDMKNNMFTPQEINIKAGDTVTWTNQDPAKHDVNFGDFKSPLLSKGETYFHTFETAGTYDYVCDVHPFMKGRVVVQ